MLKMSLIALFGTSALAMPAGIGARHANMASAPTRYVIAPDGNEARYRVREQRLHHDLPSDAVGKTTAITGGISITSNGTVDTAASRITIDVTTLESDQERRDSYVKHRTLETEQYPSVVFFRRRCRARSSRLPEWSRASTFRGCSRCTASRGRRCSTSRQRAAATTSPARSSWNTISIW